MADFYCKSGSGVGVQVNKAWSAGERMVPTVADASANVATARKWVWECTTPGTSNGVPTWPASVTQDVTTINQNGVVWTARKPGFSSGTTADWTFATPFLHYAAQAIAAGDRVFLSNNHNNLLPNSLTYSFPGTVALPNQILCVNDAAAPPTALATTAIEGTDGTSAGVPITVSGSFYMYGVNLKCSVSGNSSSGIMTLCATAGCLQVYESCELVLAANAAGLYIIPGSASSLQSTCRLINTKLSFGVSSATIHLGETSNRFEWHGGSLGSGSVAITTLFGSSGGKQMDADLIGVDLSGAASSLNIVNVGVANALGHVMLKDCRMPSSWSGSPITGTNNLYPGMVELHNCDSGSANYRLWIKGGAGECREEATLVKSGGATDGTTPFSIKMVSTGNASYPAAPLELSIFIRNDATGSPVTVTVDVLHDSLTNLQDKDFWLSAMYLGSASYPVASRISGRAGLLATAADLATSSASWTTTGLTNPNKQKAAVTFTPQMAGWYLIKACLGLASKTIYVDTLPVLS